MILGVSDFALSPVLPGKVTHDAAQGSESFEATFALTAADTEQLSTEVAPPGDDDSDPEDAEAGAVVEQSDFAALPEAWGNAENAAPDPSLLSSTAPAGQPVDPTFIETVPLEAAALDTLKVTPPSHAALQQTAVPSRDPLSQQVIADLPIADAGMKTAQDVETAPVSRPTQPTPYAAEVEGVKDAKRTDGSAASVDKQHELSPQKDSKGIEPRPPTDPNAAISPEKSFDRAMIGIPESLKAELTLHQSREARSEAPSGPPIRHHPAQAHEVARQITDRLLASDQNRIEITLTPEELGKIKLVITPGDTPSISVYSENRETLDLLRRNAELLQRELRDTGFGEASLFFGQENQSKTPAAYSKARFDATAERSPDAVQAIAPRNSLDRRLDIRI